MNGNDDPDMVLNTDNGIIAIALNVYVDFAERMNGDQRLIDRARELSIIFRDMDPKQRYE